MNIVGKLNTATSKKFGDRTYSNKDGISDKWLIGYVWKQSGCVNSTNILLVGTCHHLTSTCFSEYNDVIKEWSIVKIKCKASAPNKQGHKDKWSECLSRQWIGATNGREKMYRNSYKV
jgi:hypothetical protein